MPTPSPSPAMIRAAAKVAQETGVTVEFDPATGVVRVLPPGHVPPQTVNPADLVDMRK